MGSIRSGEPHRLESHQPGRQHLLTDSRELPESRTRRVGRHLEIAGDSVQRLGSRHDQPVKRCEALQWDLPAERDSGVLFRSVAKLNCGEMLRHGPQTASDILPIQLECLAAAIDTPESDVDVGMFRVKCDTATHSRMCGGQSPCGSSCPS